MIRTCHFPVPFFLLMLAGCGSHETSPAAAPTAAAPAPVASNPAKPVQVPLVSKLRMNDPAAPAQLIKGFYGVENGWRWTAGHFSVVLKTPPGAAARGGTVTFGFTISGAVLTKVHDQTLTASIAGKALKSETYQTDGNHTFTADIPADLLTGDIVTIDFAVDKSLPSSPGDRRELAVIATAIGIESK